MEIAMQSATIMSSIQMNFVEEPVTPFPASMHVKDISVTVNSREVLKNVSTVAQDRKILAVIGPSGSGKSTLMRTMNRTLDMIPGAKITSGNILFRQENLCCPTVDQRLVRKRIGMVQQKPVAFPMSIKENVLFGVRFHKNVSRKEADEVVEKSLKQSGLWNEVKDRLNDPASRLSIGQLQRLCIARTLANGPEVLLMDEPCSALDPISTGKIEEMIMTLKQSLPVVIVTHNLAQARRISDFCLFLSDGVALEQGFTEQIFTAPQQQQVYDFVSGKVG